MYAYAKVIIERPGVRALPAEALTYVEDKAYCWTYEGGHAVRTEVRTGVSDGQWVEVTNRLAVPGDKIADGWVPIDGREKVIVGDLTLLADGVPVQVAPETEATRLAVEAPAPDRDRAGAVGAPGTLEAPNAATEVAETEM
jgi:hypothetical protein